MDQTTDIKIKQFIIQAAKQNPGLIAAYLFGSYAKNKQRPGSDIDVALIWENINENDKFHLQVQLLLLAHQFDNRIEPHPLSQQDFISYNPFSAEIKNTGIEIPFAK